MSLPIATRQEIVGFDVFDEPSPLGSTKLYGIAISLTPREAGPATVHLWMSDAQQHQDEYAMRRTIATIEKALGPIATT
ncbi:hypothetical protein [Curtobacterium herbarum]|uniref:hypothetical protein n=1 Tax=Curtobacterium herbarum TaxID=150122 RepID=UPI00195F0DAF|nr:hypothetical protein [Curtobacterium herbarum]MBM7475928.1 hypothetical protein [Curtobacterium herbarum]MCS6544503.1 hypothetical protein [Curtobacterium herbarum]